MKQVLGILPAKPSCDRRSRYTVEIDECLLVRRKYNVGHQVGEQWVYGGYMMW